MTETMRYVGGPGTGKTKTLETLARTEVTEHSKTLNDMMFLSFSNAQCHDLQRKLKVVFPLATQKSLDEHVRTIHGAALSGCIKENLIERGEKGKISVIDEAQYTAHYQNFCKKHGLKYDPRYANILNNPDEDFTAIAKDVPTGNAVFLLSRYIRNMEGMTPEDWQQSALALHLRVSRFHDMPSFINAWTAYKNKHHLYEHDDYVALADKVKLDLNESTIFIDEFQDLSPAQYHLVRNWQHSGNHDHIYIAGDPNQAIYSFRGADPRFLQEIEARDLGAWGPGSMPRSHRCPFEVIDIADHVLAGKSNMTPAYHFGIVKGFTITDGAQISDLVLRLHAKYGKVLLLARFTLHAMKISRILSNAGIPHVSLSQRRQYGWGKMKTPGGERIDMAMLLEQCRYLSNPENYRPANDIAAREFIELFMAARVYPPFFDGNHARRDGETRIHPSDIFSAFNLPMTPSSVYAIIRRMQINPQSKTRLVNALQRPTGIQPSAVILDTIHAAKGYEAPAVVLCSDYLRDRLMDYHHDPGFQAEERRIYYVGCTRASRELCLINMYTNPVFPAFGGYASC
jgi:ATP-dependent exoDNAse (exonuclease V) beta subunit